jgi:hypothetical protein
MTTIATPDVAIPPGFGSNFGPRTGDSLPRHSKPRSRPPRLGGSLPPPEAAEGLTVAPVASQGPSRADGPRPSLPAGLGARPGRGGA